jgi:acetylornithine/succinyldiaminopimelate/putrescine aminotransferase
MPGEMERKKMTVALKWETLPTKPAHKKLLAAIVHDPALNPERTGATLARIEEVLGIVLGDTPWAKDIFSACREAAGDASGPFDALPAGTGIKVAAILVEALEPSDGLKAAEHLMQSELSTDEVIALHKKYKIPVSHLEDDVLPVKGDGAKIVDSKGKVYIDLDSNYSATNLGNSNAEIALGLYNQAGLLIAQKEDRIQVARARFLKEINGMLPQGLECFYWQNSGGEAVDKALKIAKACTGQTGVVAFHGGFHGRTHGAVAVTHNIAYRKPFGLDNQPWVHFAPFGDAAAVEELLASGRAKIVILELVQGEEAGVRPAAPEFAAALRSTCDEHGALLIVDEVQTGFGRVSTGEGEWFACQSYGIVPDLMVIGKSFGGGYPVTAVVTSPKVSSAMKPGYDGSTFGGNPMAMTAALIATRQMKALNLPVLAAERAEQFRKALTGISSPLLKGFRTAGLMIGIDLVSAECVGRVQEIMKKHGALSSLSTGATLRWMPPLVISEAEVIDVVEAFIMAIKEIETNSTIIQGFFKKELKKRE